MATLYAGTSGFAYPAWKPAFYPARLPARLFLKHYSERLNSVEINYTFRRLPAPSTLATWVEATRPGFVFAVKANMRITHILRLKDAGEATDRFLKAIDPLRTTGRLGPVLFQLPPDMKCDLGLLRDYLAGLPGGVRYAFEFRHASWLHEGVYEELRKLGAAVCAAESEKLEVPDVATADFHYYRLRKPDYAEGDLDVFAERFGRSLASGGDVYAMFKHEDTPRGALLAEQLLSRLACSSGAH